MIKLISKSMVTFLAGLLTFFGTGLSAQNASPDLAHRIVSAARSQIGITVSYDPSYQSLAYPLGDIDRSRGVCSDVVIRALRDGAQIDLQQLVHVDMKRNFSAYPTRWGLKRTDKNIDHRRVLNLRRYLTRAGTALPVTDLPTDYHAGDIVSWNLGGSLTHIGLVAEQFSTDGVPMIIHNIGHGTQREDILFGYKITGHFRPSLKSW